MISDNNEDLYDHSKKTKTKESSFTTFQFAIGVRTDSSESVRSEHVQPCQQESLSIMSQILSQMTDRNACRAQNVIFLLRPYMTSHLKSLNENLNNVINPASRGRLGILF